MYMVSLHRQNVAVEIDLCVGCVRIDAVVWCV
jgi:hypothetical protein